LATACVLSGPALGATCRGSGGGYSYAGFQGPKRVYGVAATISALAAPRVRAGHVAGWVGLGWSGGGPNGQDEWIQVGLTAEKGDSRDFLYVEVVKPGAAYRFDEVARVNPGDRHRIAVLEVRGRPGWWRVWIDRRPATEPIFLPQSHAAWEPVITSESWNGNVGACNPLAYRFERVQQAKWPGGGWTRVPVRYRFQDAGYRLVQLTRRSFLAAARSLLGQRHGKRFPLHRHRPQIRVRARSWRPLAAPLFGVFG
jgi:hypothetical protein